jgi:DNA-binding NtrC family response regulator
VQTLSRFECVPLAVIAELGMVASDDRHLPVVLVVDDEEVITDTRAAILSNWGYAVLSAYDAESALELARLIPPELLISDVMLAQINGVDLAIAIQREVPDCRVILFSGLADSQELVASANRSGHDFAFLAKPVHPAHLWAILAEMNIGGISTPSSQPKFDSFG